MIYENFDIQKESRGNIDTECGHRVWKRIRHKPDNQSIFIKDKTNIKEKNGYPTN